MILLSWRGRRVASYVQVGIGVRGFFFGLPFSSFLMHYMESVSRTTIRTIVGTQRPEESPSEDHSRTISIRSTDVLNTVNDSLITNMCMIANAEHAVLHIAFQRSQSKVVEFGADCLESFLAKSELIASGDDVRVFRQESRAALGGVRGTESHLVDEETTA